MPKLYFRYGAMGSGKTVELLVALYQYTTQHPHKQALLIKPAIDTRNGEKTVWSRVPGLSREADLVLQEALTADQLLWLQKVDCIFVDESQFLHPHWVEQLSWISQYTPVICYGLRTDFRGQLFPGSRALLTWADAIEEVKSVCRFCDAKATHNLKIKGSTEAHIELGADDTYVGVCKRCFYQRQKSEAVRQHTVYLLADITS